MRVVVAMSGGVDSSTVAALLHEQGHEVIGVHMKLHEADPGKAGHCCGLDDALDARAVADRLGIAFHVMDLREAFRRAVEQDLVETYLAGRTPNPCVRCNGVLKFRVLLGRALALGADALATGHYARVEPQGVLRMARDADKDQSYFLFPVTREALQRTLFPLGDLRKDQVREQARRLGLVTADKAESQEICFIPDQDHAGYVQRQRPDADGRGLIVDEQGRVLGEHAGYWRFTVGQRKGLGIAMGHRVYVKQVEPDSGRVVVGGAEGLWHRGLQASGWTWSRPARDGEQLLARIRHRGRLIPARVRCEGQAVALDFEEPAWAVAPGQAVVLYEGDRVVGGGWIDRAIEEAA